MTSLHLWLIKLFLSHLLTDFVLQPTTWVEERNRKHFSSNKLYLHALVTAILAYVLIGWHYWAVALIILVTHFFIDGWKSYRPQGVSYFLIDQLLHLLVIFGCWTVLFDRWSFIGSQDRQEAKTEYLVIGTLLSIGIAMLTGLAVRALS